jgi:hypothetical protein
MQLGVGISKRGYKYLGKGLNILTKMTPKSTPKMTPNSTPKKTPDSTPSFTTCPNFISFSV